MTSALCVLVKQRGLFAPKRLPRDVATHGTTDARISHHLQLQVPQSCTRDLLEAYVLEDKPSLFEFIGVSFRFFLEVCFEAEVTHVIAKDLVVECTRSVMRFFADSVFVREFNCVVLYTEGCATTRMRIVYPRICVERKRALKMHSAIISHFQSVLCGETRAAISSFESADQEVVMSERWSTCFPADVYLSPRGIQMPLSYQFKTCDLVRSSDRTSHMNCMCCNSRHVVVGGPLLLYGCFDRRGDRVEKSERAMQQPFLLLDSSSLRGDGDGLLPPLTEWADPLGHEPAPPFKETANGPVLERTFATEKAGHKKTASRRFLDPSLPNDRATLLRLRDVVRKVDKEYAQLEISSAWTSGRTGSHFYHINVKNRGSCFCQNANGHHDPDEPGFGRIYFYVDRRGASQRCYCQATPSSTGIQCTAYKQTPTPLTIPTRHLLKFFQNKGHGDFWDQLPGLLDDISKRILDERPKKKRKRWG